MKLHHVLPLLLVSALASAHASDRVYLGSKLARDQHLPFSSGVLVGGTLYIAGTTGVDPAAKGPVTAEQEAHLVLDRVKQAVESAGLSMDDIVSVQVFCTDLGDYQAFNDVYRTYFHEHYPARAFVGASKLLFGARYEVMGIAVRAKK